MGFIQVEVERYIKLFRAHMGFIINSCELYDDGYRSEALRFATSFRVLFYDTSKSTSLLKHLGVPKSNILLHDSMGGLEKNWAKNTQIYINPKAMYSQKLIDLEKVKEPKVIPWTQWWENVVFATNGGLIDRKLTMLSLANQDGGVHADVYNSLPESYRIFSEGMWMRDGKTNKPLGKDANLDVMRNMANEVLISPDIIALFKDPLTAIEEFKNR